MQFAAEYHIHVVASYNLFFKKKLPKGQYCQQSFWIWRLSRHKIQFRIDLLVEAFSNNSYIWTFIQNDGDKI